MRIFLSFNSKDSGLAAALRAGIARIEPTADIFLSSVSLGPGFWLPKLDSEIADADAFLLLIGPKGVGPWQKLEYYSALDRHVANQAFPLVPVVTAAAHAPGLPFLRNLNWVEVEQLADDAALHRVVTALKGETVAAATPLWKLVNPYRGLEAMTEDNADYFHGRSVETANVLSAFANNPGRCPILIGASGVGKSSVAQAGVLSALKSMRWRTTNENAPAPWPARLANSRSWLQLTMRPGDAPFAALTAAVTRSWQLDSRDPDQAGLPRKWAERLMTGDNTLGDLIGATQEELKKRDGEAPSRILLYVDQGEELYTRSTVAEARRFTEVLTAGLSDSRLFAFASMRADYFDKLQADQALFCSHEHIDVPPLDRAQLAEVVTAPARALNVDFEDNFTADRITTAAAAQPGALPLLSYLLTAMWSGMVDRNDHTLRLPAQVIDIGGVLAGRAEEFLQANPGQETVLRRLLTLKLSAVPAEGEPVRRETRRQECSDAEWALACSLADYPWRLVVTSEREGDGAFVAEVAHEALLRAWPRLKDWLRDERDFLVFKNEAERAEKRWQEVKMFDEALLGGIDLKRAEAWLPERADDLPPAVAAYIQRSIATDRGRKLQQIRLQRRVIGGIAAAIVMAAISFIAVFEWRQAVAESNRADANLTSTQVAESQFLGELAQVQMTSGDFVTAMLVALPGLPDASLSSATGGLRPYVVEVEGKLFEGYLGNWEHMLLAGHNDGVNSVAISPDGKRIVTGSSDSARVWDAATGTQIAAFSSRDGPFGCVAIDGDGNRIFTTNDDNVVHVWDVAKGTQSAGLTGSGASFRCVTVSGDGRRIVAGADDGKLTVWDAAAGTQIAVLDVAGATAARVASGSDAAPVGDAGGINSVAVSSDGTRIVAGYSDKAARVWDVSTATVLAVLAGHELLLASVAISQDGTHVATGSFDQTACSWDVATRAKVCISKKLGAPVRSVAISPDGKRIATGSDDNTARIWDMGTGAEIQVLRGHIGGVVSVAFIPGGAGIVTGSDDKTARIWTAATDAEVKTLSGHTGSVSSVAFSADGKLLVSGSWDKTARSWDAHSGQPIRVFDQHSDRVAAVAIDDDGKRMVTGSWDGTAKIWDTDSGQVAKVLSGQIDQVSSVAISADGSRVVTGEGETNKAAQLWDSSTARKLTLIPKLAGRVTGVLLTPKGDRIITAAGTSARVWDAAGGQQIIALLGHTNSVLSLALTPDGTRLVTGSRDMTARIWDLATGKTLATLRGHTGAVTSVAVSPNGRWIVTASSDGTVQLWDASTGDQIAIIAADAVPVNSIAISPDGMRIASGWRDNFVRLSPLFFPTTQALIDRVKQTVPRCLTLAQLKQLHLLPLQPPRWCITGSGNEHEADSTKWHAKWPYQSEAWRNWLIASDKGQHVPMPEQ